MSRPDDLCLNPFVVRSFPRMDKKLRPQPQCWQRLNPFVVRSFPRMRRLRRLRRLCGLRLNPFVVRSFPRMTARTSPCARPAGSQSLRSQVIPSDVVPMVSRWVILCVSQSLRSQVIPSDKYESLRTDCPWWGLNPFVVRSFPRMQKWPRRSKRWQATSQSLRSQVIPSDYH